MHKEHQKAQLDVHEVSKEREKLRTIMTEEAESAKADIEVLQRSLADQKAASLAVERSLREYHDKLDAQWSRSVR
jgi:hypothetical protein